MVLRHPELPFQSTTHAGLLFKSVKPNSFVPNDHNLGVLAKVSPAVILMGGMSLENTSLPPPINRGRVSFVLHRSESIDQAECQLG